MSSGTSREEQELQVIDLMYQNFPSLNIDQDLLVNWQVELLDKLGDFNSLSSIVSNDIIIDVDMVDFDNVPNVSSILDRLEAAFDDEDDFKIIVLEILICLISLSYRIKIVLSLVLDQLIDLFLTKLKAGSDFAVGDIQKPSVVGQYMRLIILFMDLGCDTKQFKRLINQLMVKKSPRTTLILLELLSQTFTKYPSQFPFLSIVKQLNYSFNKDTNLKRAFTIHSWLKINHQLHNSNEDPITLFTLSSSGSTNDDENNGTLLKVQIINYNQFKIEIKNNINGSRIRYSFNQKLLDLHKNQGFVHFVLTYDNYATLNLYIDGEYSESIPCPDLHKYLKNWNKVSVSETREDITMKSDEIVLRNLTILNTNLSYEWVSLLYNLGLGFSWDVKDLTHETALSLLNQLSHQGLFNVTVKCNEIKEQTNTNNSATNLFGAGHTSSRSTLAAFGGNLRYHHHHHNHHNRKTNTLVRKEKIANSLTRIKDENVVFDSNTYFQELIYESKKHGGTSQSNSLGFNNPNTIYQVFNIIGGTSLLLKVLETSLEVNDAELRDALVYTTLTLLFTVLSNNWRLNKEFESFEGYDVLSVLLTKYKELNKELTFQLHNEEQTTTSLFNVLLRYSGHDFENPFESAVVNPLSYRILNLNFDLHYGTSSFNYLLFQIHMLLHTSRHKEYNYHELRNMKLLRKLVHFLKELKIDDFNISQSFKEQLAQTLAGILELDASVETIMSLSQYIVFALYNGESSTECGIITFQVLTDYLCDPSTSIKTLKKFSRSIHVHLILLLFRFQGSEVVIDCGIRLITKLLKVLGTPIIKKFFQLNRGLDVLTLFLKGWWLHDTILYSIFLAAFGIDTEVTHILKSSKSKTLVDAIKLNANDLNQLVMPDFLILLNNLVLNSMYTLNLKSGKLLGSNPPTPDRRNTEENVTLSLNTLHLINQYIDSISLGFETVKPLQKFYTSKEFLEGITELLGYLRLSLKWENADVQKSMRSTYDKLIKVIANFYISNLSNDTFLLSFDKLSDFTKKLLLDLVFPKVLDHINQFITVSNFVFNEKQFFNNTIQLLHHYNEELLKQKYYVSYQDFDAFLVCAISTSDIGIGHNIGYLKRMLGDNIVIKFLRLVSDTDVMFDQSIENLDCILKELLYRQTTSMSKDVVSNEQLVYIITLLLGIVLTTGPDDELPNPELPFNYLRTFYLMRQDEFPGIIDHMNYDKNLVRDFFNNLVTKNDSETLMRLQKYPPFVKSVIKESHLLKELYAKTDYQKVSNMITVTLHNGGKLGQMSNIYIKSFEKDCELMKNQIMNSELIKFNRLVQDNEENIKHAIATYHGLKTEITRLFNENDSHSKNYVLDYIENVDRMRRRLVVEDQIPESERLTYNIDIPLKRIDSFTDASFIHEYDYAISATGIDTLSISNDDMPSGDDAFELVDSNDEAIEESEHSNAFEDKNRKVSRSLFFGDQIVTIWNISQVNGLVPIESLMILGLSHLYLIENYILSKDGNVIDVNDAPEELRDPILQLVNSQSNNILKNENKLHRSKNWSLDKLSCISKRQFLLRDIALEMFFSDGASILITCMSTKDRDAIYSKLCTFASGKGIDYDLTQALQSSSANAYYTGGSTSASSTSFLSSKLVSALSQSGLSSSISFLEATKKWKMGEMSNFYYLMIINTLAGRTFNDLSQYPVFPWVIADYTSETLDLSDPRTFRDLSKPMGAQTTTRANKFKERFEALDSLNDRDAPAFHYGTHYSSAMIVTSFLIRLKPYVQSYLLLQGGKFDHADRLFNSVEKAWLSASRDNTTDVRELTPEFYYLPEFLVNSNNFEFGKLQNGESSHDVQLPPWANGDPKVFIAKNREALESSYVSANLHLWIDLIFGYKQNGEEAVRALNVFHHLSYNGAINLDNISDETEKRAVIGMINNFGQTPSKLFTKPHPMKDVLNLPNYYLTLFDGDTTNLKTAFESKMKAPIVKLEMSSKNAKRWVGRQSCISCEDDLLIRKAKKLKYESGSLLINDTLFLNLHTSNITTLLQLGHKLLVTGSSDGTVYVWKCNLRPSTNLANMAILRGHLASILKIVFSKSFKFGASIDSDGYVIIWDFIRFQFVRKLAPPSSKQVERAPLLTVSNDSGNFATVHFADNQALLRLFTVNGEPVMKKVIDYTSDNPVTAISFANTNTTMVDTDKTLNLNRHIYWSNEIFAISRKKTVEIWELVQDNSDWTFKNMDQVDFGDKISGDITAIELFKCSEVDHDDKLIRGELKLIVGDSVGKVYTL
ncbi:Beige 1 [Candida viswanathii]|uniref:Beige 1 n=1 Tax=Candida viswanathii TaxID=5486 RepID=A0A367Y4A8_9ASCO|nr:Beige 1 [Candida viswanathii]